MLAIKNAEYEYDDLVSRAEEMKEELELVYHSSNLLVKPDLHKINSLLISTRNEYYTQNG
ncbi:hypothetical protein [Tenacibaculum ovolyticum]|uniref:hypothetical protein n=1 Tax=Tenacibaculum ovolyticum TaxID=104270 RepID=UPI003BAA82F6